MKRFTAVLTAAALLTAAAYAQPIPGLSPKEKVQLERKQERDKDVDKAYKSTRDLIPAGKDPDPWGNLRTPNAPPSTGTK